MSDKTEARVEAKTETKNEIVAVDPEHMGSRAEIVAVRNRILSMMTGAEKLPAEVQWAAAQMAVAYRLDPFNGEMYIAKTGSYKDDAGNWQNVYTPMIGIKGMRTLARRQAHYITDNGRVMPAEEVQMYRRELYDENDVGIEIQLWRLDIVGECKRLGLPYFPIAAQGFWRVKAKFNKGDKTWYPDEIPNTWSAKQVAEKRAEKTAVIKAFDLRVDPSRLADPAVDFEAELADAADTRDRDFSMTANRVRVLTEEDGDVIYAATDKR